MTPVYYRSYQNRYRDDDGRYTVEDDGAVRVGPGDSVRTDGVDSIPDPNSPKTATATHIGLDSLQQPASSSPSVLLASSSSLGDAGRKRRAGKVGHLEEAYQEWVHQPIVSKEGPRFFQNEILEFLTRTVWWAVPVIWLPVVCWCLAMSVERGIALPLLALMVVTGILLWTLIEYTLHRFIFHMKTESYWGNTAHYLLHGCHHKHPMDGLRLVFPPAATAILCLPFWNLVKLICSPTLSPALFGGGLLGYVIYDCTHYYLHHGQPTREPGKNLKRYHLNHHFRIQNKGFGITSSLWDIIFGTLPSKKSPSKTT